MTQKILLISGKKQSGKDSAANYLSGYLLKQAGATKEFKLDEDGKLLIRIQVEDPSVGKVVEEMGLLDLERKDEEYVRYASQMIWPIIKIEKFGDLLKDILIATNMAKREELYGTNADKDKLSNVKWSSYYTILDRPNEHGDDFMSNRELMEIFGSDICRELYQLCWVEGLFNRIIAQDFPLVVIADCRYPDEVEYAKMLGAKVVRLTRNPLNGKHQAETALDNYKNFDYVIDNVNMSQEQKGAELVKYLQELGWIS